MDNVNEKLPLYELDKLTLLSKIGVRHRDVYHNQRSSKAGTAFIIFEKTNVDTL